MDHSPYDSSPQGITMVHRALDILKTRDGAYNVAFLAGSLARSLMFRLLGFGAIFRHSVIPSFHHSMLLGRPKKSPYSNIK